MCRQYVIKYEHGGKSPYVSYLTIDGCYVPDIKRARSMSRVEAYTVFIKEWICGKTTPDDSIIALDALEIKWIMEE